MARSLKTFGQPCFTVSYGEIPVIGRPARLQDVRCNLRLGEMSFCSFTVQFIIPDNCPQSSTFPNATNATSAQTAAPSVLASCGQYQKRTSPKFQVFLAVLQIIRLKLHRFVSCLELQWTESLLETWQSISKPLPLAKLDVVCYIHDKRSWSV